MILKYFILCLFVTYVFPVHIVRIPEFPPKRLLEQYYGPGNSKTVISPAITDRQKHEVHTPPATREACQNLKTSLIILSFIRLFV
ncbi:unnamed protein product [Caenorhabditis angaria]|uniref:Secreted protein n=1 Tax=Caenorhabditis angaria TaxID=860376 RepID=A0A9P1NAD2_9PELO|nr:unnamed protein product [Caenorhabditis angaria]